MAVFYRIDDKDDLSRVRRCWVRRLNTKDVFVVIRARVPTRAWFAYTLERAHVTLNHALAYQGKDWTMGTI